MNREPSVLRYIALGDSHTIGTAVAPGQRWPDQLLARLDAVLPADRLLIVTIPDYTVTPRGAHVGDSRERAASIRKANGVMARLTGECGIACVDIHDLSRRAAGDPAVVAGDRLIRAGSRTACGSSGYCPSSSVCWVESAPISDRRDVPGARRGGRR